MLCPFCLKENTIKKVEENGRIYYVCSEHAFPTIPIIYVEKEKIPRDVISAIGFRLHGKSAYFASLFLSLDDLTRVWPNFFTFPIDEKSLETVHDNVKLLKGGTLPGRTPSNFPIPTIVQFSDMPKFKDRFLIFCDTGGESFSRASNLIANADFVKRSQTAIFFMSLPDLDYSPQEMSKLLQVYIQGLTAIGGDPKQQHLLIVLTKGDLLASKLEAYTQIWEYLVNGDVKNLQYANINTQITEMKKISILLKTFLRNEIGATNFMALGQKNFRSLEVCIISALGAAPNGEQLDISATPKRIFDPILWVMYNSTGILHKIQNFFFRVKISFSNFIKRTQTSTKKETQGPSPPINIKKIAKYGSISIIVLIMISLAYLAITNHIDIGPIVGSAKSDPTSTPTTTITQIVQPIGIMLPEIAIISGFGTSTYYFDIDNAEKINFIRIWVDGAEFTDYDFIIGKDHIPSSFSSPRSDEILQDIGLRTEQYDLPPTNGRYYIVVKNKGNNGSYKISRTIFYK